MSKASLLNVDTALSQMLGRLSPIGTEVIPTTEESHVHRFLEVGRDFLGNVQEIDEALDG